jgi:hypothetical protein
VLLHFDSVKNMAEHSHVVSSKQTTKYTWGCLRILCATVLALYVAFKLLMFYEREENRESGLLLQSRSINLFLCEYANDHGGKYPEGKTSTEVFQRIIDAGYNSDPSNQEEASGPDIFYFPMPGKVKPTSRTLKPENVCWDVTCCLDESSPDQMPVVYVTGYKVIYEPGASALPEKWPARTWWEWLTSADYPRGFIAATYKSNNTAVLRAASDGSIPNFIPSPFYGNVGIYRQLTPDGNTP